MRHFIHYELDFAEGDVVEVIFDAHYTLGNSGANIQLLDDANFALYRQNKPFEYTGGSSNTSPVHLAPPSPGRWHLVLDLGGGPGRLRASCRILSAQPN